MKHRILTALSAAAVSAALFAAWPSTAATTQLRETVADQLAEHHITVPNFASLTNAQLAQIQLVLSTNEGGDKQKAAMVNDLLAEQAECQGNPQLRQNVANQLKEHRIEVTNYDKITGSELVVIKTILDSSSESDAAKKDQIARIFAAKSPITGGAYLKEDTAQCVKMVGADIDLDKLTPDQMLQIQLIATGGDDKSAKRAAIEKIGAQ
ncbi:MAG: hypothetical protein U1E59_20190 [Amaricoccus sp.]